MRHRGEQRGGREGKGREREGEGGERGREGERG